MFRCFCTFLLICLLAACIRQPVRHRQSYETFVGINEAELVYTIGPPDNIYEIGKERFLTYYKNGSTYLNGGYIPRSCKITFVFFKKRLDNWHYEGNMCDEYIASINLH